ncbi:MAG: SPOR domain-containing protein [Bacteroidia bacterium]|nr:SPOR domain-containing protein [Bacteroidia bacterium]
MKLSFTTLFFVILFGYSFPQSFSTLKAYFDDADYDISQEDYSSALNKFLRIYKVDTLNSNINYEIGICYLNSVEQKRKAVKHLEKAIKEVTPNYQNGTYTERKAPYDAYLQMANAYALENEFDKALDYYNLYKATLLPRENALKAKVERKMESCYFAKILVKHPVTFEKTEIPDINSVVSDYNPVVTSDESQMFFTFEQLAGKSIGEKRIYHVVKSDGKWGQPINYTDLLASDGNLSTVFITYDGKTLLLCDDDESKISMYESKFEKKQWTVPKKLPRKINSASSPSASMSKDGKTIYFSNNHKGGFGGFDLYKIVKKGGEWSEPVNLGPSVNTPFDEICPVILEENKTLFFSSEGHSSMGGLDVFYSRLDAQGGWCAPVNMGYPFNTPDDNAFYWPLKDGFSGYISLYDESGQGEKDIYFVKVTPDKKFLFTVDELAKLGIATKDTAPKILSVKDTSVKDFSTHDILKKDSSETTVYKIKKDTTLMTIMIKDTTRPLESAYLKEIEGVKALRSVNGFFRYYYGVYKNYDDASKDFDKILKIGFYSAQLINISEDSLYYLAKADFNFGADTSQADQLLDLVDNTDTRNNRVKDNKSKNKISLDDITLPNPDTKAENKEAIKKEKAEKKAKEKAEKEARKKAETEEKARIKAEAEKAKAESKKQKTEAKAKKSEKNAAAENKTADTLPAGRQVSAKYLNEITEKLINSDKEIFVIQIATVAKAGNVSYFKNIPYVTEHDCKDGKYRYSIGIYQSMEDAKKELEKIKEAGYKDAYVVNFLKFKTKYFDTDIANRVKTFDLKTEEEKAKAEETKLYAIQIGSSIKPVNPGYFKGVSDVKEKLTRNGYYKYYYGKYAGYKAAKAELENARNAGYKDAFIIKYTGEDVAKTLTSADDNTTPEPHGTYTIQVASSKKRAEAKYFKGLDVKEIEGKNGFYIYITGDYNSVGSARKDLKKVIGLGFKDAFINRTEKYQ